MMETGHAHDIGHIRTKSRARSWRINLLASATVFVLVTLPLLFLAGSSLESRFVNDPALTSASTSVSNSSTIAASVPMQGFKDSLAVPVLGSLLDWIKKARGQKLISYTFPPSPPGRYLVQALLAQSEQATGMHYLIENDVATGTINFGTTNNLDAEHWQA